MKNNLSAFFVGFIFALGLGISGMTDTHKVLGFLDVFGEWDPSLVFVMVGAVLMHLISYKLIRRRATPVLSVDWHVPEKSQITRSLIAGSAIFGIGWGFAGFCPGPAVTSMASLQPRPVLFVICMLVGMLVFKIADNKFNFNR